jgi:hypothetical protein
VADGALVAREIGDTLATPGSLLYLKAWPRLDIGMSEGEGDI